MSAALLERPVTGGVDVDEPSIAHIGRAGDVNRAYITGEEITALCGERFIPTRDPQRYPVCESCKHFHMKLTGGRGRPVT